MADVWTDAEKSSLLMQIIAQLKPEKGGINWDLIHIEGRTRKACQNTWGKFMAINKQQQALGGDGEKTASPAKATPRKRNAKKQDKAEEKAEGSDDDLEATPPAKKPRARARKPKLDNDIDVPSPQTIEDVKLFTAPDEEVKPNIEYAI